MAAVDDSTFEVRTKREDGSVWLIVSGELDLSSAEDLEAAIRAAENSDAEKIIVDLEGLTFIDSAGVQVLVEARYRDRKRGLGRVLFTAPRHKAVEQVFQVGGMSKILGLE